MNKKTRSSFHFISLQSLFFPIIIFSALFFLPVGFVLALPTGENVESGEASFDRPDSNTLNVTTSDKVIIQWNNFDIASHETVNFYQPFSSSCS